MKKFKELIKTPEYWIETIQNELFRQLTDYIKRTGKSQSEIAKELKVSKSYISQILNGNFNFTIKKLIELSLYIGKMPSLNFIDLNTYLQEYNKAEQEDQTTQIGIGVGILQSYQLSKSGCVSDNTHLLKPSKLTQHKSTKYKNNN